MQINCSFSKTIPIGELIPSPYNTNKHPKKQIQLLAKILKYQGWRHPIVVSKLSQHIVAGHGRLEAAIEAGFTEVPVDYQGFENEAQEMAFLESDNLIADLAQHDFSMMLDNIKELQLDDDFDLELFGIPNLELPTLKELDDANEDTIPERVDTRCKPGDVWTLGQHRLMCGDSTSIDAVETLMNSEKADMVFTDPPYGDGHAAMVMDKDNMKSGQGNIVAERIKIKNDENLDIMTDVATNAAMVTKEKAPKLVFFKWSKWEQIKEHWSSFGEPSSCCVWDRDQMAAATFIFNPCHEFAFFWGSLANKQNKSNLSNVWRCKKESENKALHPTVKPIEICENAIDAACVSGGLVLDLFGGSGSTLIACEKINRKCNMMELDAKFCDVILTRWESYTGDTATRVIT